MKQCCGAGLLAFEIPSSPASTLGSKFFFLPSKAFIGGGVKMRKVGCGSRKKAQTQTIPQAAKMRRPGAAEGTQNCLLVSKTYTEESKSPESPKAMY